MTKNATESATSNAEAREKGIDMPVSLPSDEKHDGLLTRAQAAARIGISVTELRRREADGRLRPRKRTVNGWHLFAVEDVEAQTNASATGLTRKSTVIDSPYTPEEAADVFDALDAGKTLVQCVRDCKVMPVVVRLLAEEYASLTGSLFLKKETVDTINTLPLEGTFPLKGERDLLAVLVAASADTCKSCSTRARVMCKPCALKLSSKVARDPL